MMLSMRGALEATKGASMSGGKLTEVKDESMSV
jgi:hypothetical protein